MREPKIIGLNVCDDRDFSDMESFSYFYLHCKANDINYYDCCVANIHAFWYALRGTSFVAEAILTDGNTYKVLVLTRIRMGAMEGLIVLIDDIEGIESGFKYLGITYRLSFYEHHKKDIIDNYPETWKLLLTLK